MSLKEKNNRSLWLITAFNSLFYYSILQADLINISDLKNLLTQAQTLVPVSIAAIVASVLNSLPSADLKATLVYWKFKYALPGHRAFTVYAARDTRINLEKLSKNFNGQLPQEEGLQNAEWYKIYKKVEHEVAVIEAHKNFLFLRDYTALSAMFVLMYGCSGLYFIASNGIAITYFVITILQYILVRQAAYNAGVRMVTNVLALETSKL